MRRNPRGAPPAPRKAPTASAPRPARSHAVSGAAFLGGATALLAVAVGRLTSAALPSFLGIVFAGAVLTGAGLGGTWVALRGGAGATQEVALRRRLPLGVAAGTALLGALFAWVPLRALGAAGAVVFGLAIYALVALTAAMAGASVALALRHADSERRSARDIYGSALGGAAAGAGASLAALNALGPPGTLSLAAVGAVLAGIRLGLPRRAPLMMVLILAVSLLTPLVRPNEPNVVAAKPLASFLDPVLYPDSELLQTQWDAASRVDVFSAPGALLLWHTPSRAREPLPELRGIGIDAEGVTTAVGSIELGRAASLARRVPASLPFAIGTRDRVLVMGAGGGMEVDAALSYGARQVDAVESNRGVAQMVLGPLSGFTDDLFRRRGVRLAVEDGRAFLRRAAQRGERYDAIVLAAPDSWAALTAGAYSLTPSTLYTRQAFDAYYARLADGGVLSVSHLYAQPPREIHRLAALARDAVARAGGDPVRRVLLLRAGQFGTLGTLLVKRGDFTTAEVQQAQTFARDNGYGVIYTPGEPTGEIAPILAGLEAGAADGRLPTDDRPFFFSHWSLRGALAGRAAWPPPQGHVALSVALAAALSALAAAVVLPARRQALRPAPGRAARWYLVAAGAAVGMGGAALGLRAAQLVGQPALGTTAVLIGLLGGAGLSRRGRGGRMVEGRGELLLAAVAVWLVAPLSGLAPEAFGTVPLEGRVLASLAGSLLAGVALGAPVRAGLAVLAPEPRPWLWGVVGTAAAAGAALAAGLAPEAGIGATLVAAGALVIVAAALLPRLARAGPGEVGTDVPGGKSHPRGAARGKMRYS